MSNIRPIKSKWKGTMADRERFNNQMNYKPTDRWFNMEFGYWDRNFQQWDVFKNNGITNNEQADEFFKFDKTSIIFDNTWMSPPCEQRIISESINA